jgi:hypothetical protein
MNLKANGCMGKCMLIQDTEQAMESFLTTKQGRVAANQ